MAPIECTSMRSARRGSVEGSDFRELLLVVDETGEAGGEGVGDAEVHVRGTSGVRGPWNHLLVILGPT